ncbi:MAG: PEP-CTERM sorting domain-containing protein, partial [Opitutales bacterium]
VSAGYRVGHSEISHLLFMGRANADLDYSNIRLYFDGETPFDEIPEPSALLLSLAAATGLCLLRRR